MEKEWLETDSNEVTSRDGRKGMASLELFFSDFRNLLTATAAKSSARLNGCERVVSVSFPSSLVLLVAPRGTGRLPRSRAGFRMPPY
jgi:hypothetical protein